MKPLTQNQKSLLAALARIEHSTGAPVTRAQLVAARCIEGRHITNVIVGLMDRGLVRNAQQGSYTYRTTEAGRHAAASLPRAP